MWLKKTFGCLEAFATYTNDATVGQGVRLYEHGCVLAQALVEVQVIRNVAELFFDLPDCLEVGCPVESISTAKEKGDEIASHIATGDVQPACEVVEDGRFVDRDDMGHAIPGVNDYSGRQTLRIESEHCLNSDVDATEVVGVEHDFAHSFAVLERVHGRFCQKDLAASCVYLQFFMEGEVPEVLHIVPFLNDAVFHLGSGVLISMGAFESSRSSYRIADLQH